MKCSAEAAMKYPGRLGAAAAILVWSGLGAGGAIAADPNLAFDGNWKGTRIIEWGSRCRHTEITGRVHRGRAQFLLVYNNTLLSGAIGADGKITFSDDNPDWEYEFEGTASGDRIEGTWRVGGVCNGTWFVERQD